jgi:hypothetical protein
MNDMIHFQKGWSEYTDEAGQTLISKGWHSIIIHAWGWFAVQSQCIINMKREDFQVLFVI